jgi:taurine dioxygenase
MFASMYAAYDALSPALREVLDGLDAVNSSALADVSKTREDRIRDRGADADREYISEHPVVRTHPETGRKALYVNRGFTTRIKELSRNESDALLAMLYDHAETPEYQCRFKWLPGSVAFWDNRAVMHHAMWDYFPLSRLAHRVTIAGDKPFYRA